jgi:flagellar hook protein FlgE
MTISSSLNAGVAGLNANATRLATISDNIANSSTYGYKRASTEFESLVISTSGGGGKYSAGGVRAATNRLVDERGGIIGTANALDLAVSGRGMLPVMPSVSMGAGGAQPLLMTRTGAFRTDAEGVLRTDSGLVLMGWPADSDGSIPTAPRDTVSGLRPIVIEPNQRQSDPTTQIELGVNLPATDTRASSTAGALPLSIEYYNNLGMTETLEITFTPTRPTPPATAASNIWTMQIQDSANPVTPLAEYTLEFNATGPNGGTLKEVTGPSALTYDELSGTLALVVADGEEITIAIGRYNQPNGMTQLSDSFAPVAITKNGSAVGNLTALEVDEKGFLMATYDTGSIRRLYQIPLVDVPNVNGLTAMNNQTYQVSSKSGSFFLWDAGDGPTGSVIGYARESSTTDVAAELTALITTQRAYSSNAKVIQTVDEMLQETTNIKR